MPQSDGATVVFLGRALKKTPDWADLLNVQSECDIDDLLRVADPSKQWFKDRAIDIIRDGSSLPGFSPSTVQLIRTMQDLESPMDIIAGTIELDPGLCMQCLKAANSASRGGHNIKSIDQAVSMLGTAEISRMAMAMGVMTGFNHLRIKVDWNRFWLHSLLVARLTHKIGSCYKESDGSEYLAGLLHDVGKLMLEHFFPREFENMLMRANGRQRSHWQTEAEMLGLTHAQIGAALCRTIDVHPRVVHAIRYHHEPLFPDSINAPFTNNGFLPCCLAVANALAKAVNTRFESNERMPDLDDLAEWHYMAEFETVASIDLDLETAREEAEIDIQAMSA